MKKVAENSTGYRIRFARDKARMTQDDLAQGLSVSKRTVIVWEKNERIPNDAMLQNIADLLEVDFHWLKAELPDNLAISNTEKHTGEESEAMYRFKFEQAQETIRKIQGDLIDVLKENLVLKEQLGKKPTPLTKKKQNGA